MELDNTVDINGVVKTLERKLDNIEKEFQQTGAELFQAQLS